MRQVSQKYIELSRLEKNNYEHSYTIKNLSRDFDLTELLENDSLCIKRFLRTGNGKISPSNINLKLSARANAPAKMLIKEFLRRYNEFANKKWGELIFEEGIDEYLVKNNDIIQIIDHFNGEDLILFTGTVSSIVKLDTDLKRTITVTVDDGTIKGYEYKFSDDVTFENCYLYNAKHKEKSLLYLLARDYLELSENQINIADINIKLPLVTFKKDTRIMEIFSELVKSFYGNIYTLPDGSLKINSLFDKSYIQKLNLTFGDKAGNHPILEFIETKEFSPKENKVEVKYSKIQAEEKQEIFSLAGQYATKDDAKIIIKANTKEKDAEWWRIDLQDVIEVDKKPIVRSYRMNGIKKEYIRYDPYILEEINNRTFRVKFTNPYIHDCYIEKFAFTGRPITRINEASIFYTEHTKLTDKQTNLKTVNLKYIGDKNQAIELAKHTFYNECRPYKTIKLRVNNMPFLELEDVINLDFKKYNGKFQIIAINQYHNLTELLLKQYEDYQAYNKFVVSEKTSINGGIKTQSQIKKEEKEAEDRLQKMENDIKATQSKIDASLTDYNLKVDKRLTKLEKDVHEFYINEQADKLKRMYKDKETTQAVINSVFLEKNYMAEILNRAYGTNFSLTLKTFNDITNSEEFGGLLDFEKGQELIFNNEQLFNKVLNNEQLFNKVLNNEQLFLNISRNENNYKTILSNEKAFNSYRIFNKGFLFKKSLMYNTSDNNFNIEAKNRVKWLIETNSALERLYSKKKLLSGKGASIKKNLLILEGKLYTKTLILGNSNGGDLIDILGRHKITIYHEKGLMHKRDDELYKKFNFIKKFQVIIKEIVNLDNAIGHNDIYYYDLDDPVI